MTTETPIATALTKSQIQEEILDSIDEELEMEFDDSRLDALIERGMAAAEHPDLDRHFYFKELIRLQKELVKLQDWVVHKKLKVVVLFEGRDAAGRAASSSGSRSALIQEPVASWRYPRPPSVKNPSGIFSATSNTCLQLGK